MTKSRIVERTYPNGKIAYVIQQKHFLFKWLWVDAWINSCDGASCRDNFSTLEEARKHLCYFDGTKISEKVIKEEK